MHVFTGVDEVVAAVGTHLGHGDWMTVTQDRIDLFADATGDHQWIHVDPERAADGPYGGTIAHGYLTLSLIPALGADLMRVEGVSMTINYGLEKVRFPSPVRSGSRVRVAAEIVDAVRTDTGARTTTRFTVEIDGATKPACVADSVRVLVA
ncbi:MaoC family dehydratase [uncultured Williamsia sp.]|uniref:MaoC family dehydratase n=1 Tax=uncultured Williamsia sp. TaxID=259311 RepID=UPI0026364006|nr:MaoC family dehydratase [uncultured Williamsia sp.]